jgi:probable aminopeptidase NPEPL1
VAAELPTVSCTVLRAEALQSGGFGGLYHVGLSAAQNGREPALVVLSHAPTAPAVDGRTVAWVGKGIVYDTGGLSLKVGGGMVGMKSDMGGSAAMLAAFRASVLAGVDHPLHLVMCIAENAIGAGAVSSRKHTHSRSNSAFGGLC